jgi:hypothetical protein
MRALRIIRFPGDLALWIRELARSARQDEVLAWNRITLDTIRATRLDPPRATRTLAMVHLAIFDAVNGIAGVYEPYHVRDPAPPGASLYAAAAVAAYTVLVGLYPERRDRLADALDASLASLRPNTARWKGEMWGHRVGEAILRERSDDGAGARVPYAPSGKLGAWQPTPPGFAPALAPQWPLVRPFAMACGDQFRAEPPPGPRSVEFVAAFREVALVGGADSPVRTSDQTESAFFWDDGPGSVTLPGHWQVIAQDLAERRAEDLLENARLFALLGMAQADAVISAWDSKYAYDHMRPITVVRAGAQCHPAIGPDPTWTSLLPVPPVPSYTSEHSAVSAASARVLALHVGSDEIGFSGTSPDPQRWPEALNDAVRRWSSLSAAAEEAGQSQIYAGVHWQYDHQAGMTAGRALGSYVFENFLRPRR